MKPIKKLSLALAAMAISGALAGPVHALTSTEVSQIRIFVESGDEAGLRAYLQQNLWLLDDSPLSVLLRDFMMTPPERSILASMGFQNPLPAELVDLVKRAKSDASLY
jgi:hypothetical protein